MRHGWRATGVAAALAALATTAACGSSDPEEAAAASSSSAAAAASAAATAAPGSYGSPVNPSLPNPTGVATDSPAPTAGPESADVVITYSGWIDSSVAVEVGAYVAGVAESGGTCTLTLTSGSRSSRAQVSGEPDASSTSCPTMAVPGDELASGPWSAVISYESATTSGQSDPVEVVVP